MAKTESVNMGERIVDRMKRLAAESKRAAPAPADVYLSKQNNESHLAAKDTASGSDAERRARTHRLIEVGAICDQYLGTKDMQPHEVMDLLARISGLDEVKKLLNQ